MKSLVSNLQRRRAGRPIEPSIPPSRRTVPRAGPGTRMPPGLLKVALMAKDTNEPNQRIPDRRVILGAPTRGLLPPCCVEPASTG